MAYAGAEIERLIVTLTAETREYVGGLGQAVEATKNFASSVADSVAGAGKLFAALAAPVAALGAKASSESAAFEHSMARLQGLSRQSADQVQTWSRQILDLAPSMGKAPEEMAKGLFFLVSGGFRGADAMDALKLASMASAAGLGEVKTIARPLKATLNAYADSGLTAARAMDIMTAAVQQSKLDAEQLAPVIGRVVPMASAMGVSFEEMLGPLAAMTRTGFSAAEAAVSMTSFFSTLLKPAKQSRAVLAQYGLEFQTLRDTVRGPNGVINVMRLLEQRFGGNEEAMARVFPNIRALRGILSLLTQDGGKVDDILKNVTNSTGALGVAFGAVADTGVFKAEQRMAQIKAILVEVGDSVRSATAPALAALAEALRAASLWWRSIGDAGRETVVGWGLAITGAATLILALKALAFALGTLKVGQLASSALWLGWVAAVAAAKLSILAMTGGLALLKAALSGALVLGLLYKALLLGWAAAGMVFNGVLAVMNVLLSPVTLLASVAGVALLTAGFVLAASAISAAFAAGKMLVGAILSIPTGYGPVAHITGLFGEWATAAKEVWALMQTDGPKAFGLLSAHAAVAFNQVKDMLPPLWRFITEGFRIVWEAVSTAFDVKFKTSVQSAKLELGRLYGFGKDTDKEQKALAESAAFSVESAAGLAKAKLEALSRGFSVEESPATAAARQAADDFRAQAGLADQMTGHLDEYYAAEKLMGPPKEIFAQAQEAAKGAKAAGEQIQDGVVPPIEKARKGMQDLKLEAVAFGSAAALARLDAYRDATTKFQPDPGGSLRTPPAVGRWGQELSVAAGDTSEDMAENNKLLEEIRDALAYDDSVEMLPADFGE